MSGERVPTPEQRAAIDIRDRDVLLEAGAGTGKTGVLVDRYCDMVADDGVTPDAILAFTFTDKAAAQLRERVRNELGRRAAAPGAPAALGEILAGFGGSWITTIHGFCRRLLAAHPVAAGTDPRFRVLDTSEAARIQLAAFDAALEDFLADRDPEREATVAAYRIDGLRTMIVAAYEELRSRGQQRPELPQVAPGDLAAALGALELKAVEALGSGGGNESQRRKIEAALELCAEREQRLPSFEALAALDLGSPKGARGECAKALRTAIARAAEAAEGGTVYEHLRELIGLFDRRYREHKERRSGLDFEDLQLLAVRLLRSSDVGELYRERFSQLMVDEFQDTNQLQLSLIEALRGPQTRLFLVGDEFQSIYGFRHADLNVFREEREALRAERRGKVLPLSGNFRSRPEIVAAANAIGSAMLPGFSPLTVGRAPESEATVDAGPPVELLLTDRKGWDSEGIDLQPRVDDRTPLESVAEARFLAARLRDLHEGGRARSEMVVLLRAFTRVDAFEEALQRAGLRPYVVGGRGYWSEQQVEDVRCLLSVIANPLDDEPLLGALASPACGVLPDTLWILRRAAGSKRSLWSALGRAVGAWEAELDDPDWLEQIPAGDLERLRAFHSRIDSLRERRPRLGLDELIERAVSETGYDLAVLRRGSGELRLANVRKLMRMAREFEQNEGRDLRGLLDFVAFRTGEDDEAVAATEAEDHDGVRVMTIHNAKGLEFPVVAVAGLGRGLLAGSRTPDLVLGRGPDGADRVGMRLARLGARSHYLYERDALHEESQALDSAEELRLFYVAATRAQERLLLSGTIGEPVDELTPSTPVAERLTAAFGVETRERDSIAVLPPASAAPGLDAVFPAAEVSVRVSKPSPERAAELVRVASAAEPQPPLTGGPPPILEPAIPITPRRPLSYSAIEEHRRCGYRFYMERVLGLEPVVNGFGASEDRRARFGFGNAVHSLLEWSATRRWIEPPAEVVRRTLQSEGLDLEEHLGRLETMIGGWLASPLREELAQRGTTVRSEVPLLVEIGGSVVRGSIDLLAEPREGVPTVVDYKTDRLGDTAPAEHAEDYRLQRDLYAMAASEASGAERVRVAYVFLERPAEPVISEVGPDQIAAARADLEAAVAEIAAGRFEVTDQPDWPLCHDCPARRRLCSGPASDPGGE